MFLYIKRNRDDILYFQNSSIELCSSKWKPKPFCIRVSDFQDQSKTLLKPFEKNLPFRCIECVYERRVGLVKNSQSRSPQATLHIHSVSYIDVINKINVFLYLIRTFSTPYTVS